MDGLRPGDASTPRLPRVRETPLENRAGVHLEWSWSPFVPVMLIAFYLTVLVPIVLSGMVWQAGAYLAALGAVVLWLALPVLLAREELELDAEALERVRRWPWGTRKRRVPLAAITSVLNASGPFLRVRAAGRSWVLGLGADLETSAAITGRIADWLAANGAIRGTLALRAWRGSAPVPALSPAELGPPPGRRIHAREEGDGIRLEIEPDPRAVAVTALCAISALVVVCWTWASFLAGRPGASGMLVEPLVHGHLLALVLLLPILYFAPWRFVIDAAAGTATLRGHALGLVRSASLRLEPGLSLEACSDHAGLLLHVRDARGRRRRIGSTLTPEEAGWLWARLAIAAQR